MKAKPVVEVCPTYAEQSKLFCPTPALTGDKLYGYVSNFKLSAAFFKNIWVDICTCVKKKTISAGERIEKPF